MVEVHDHPESENENHTRNILIVVFLLTAVFMVVEAVVGILANSLALLADAGHMLSDVLSLGLSVFALVIAKRPRNTRYTFGYYRAEILAALFNGFSLILISIFIMVEAFERIDSQEAVLGTPMLIAAILGLLVNLYGLYALRDHHHDNLNVSSAFFHIAADLLGSIAAIIASILIIITGDPLWDILISVAITVLIVISGLNIIKKAVRILMQRAPENLDTNEVIEDIKSMTNVENVHDLHLWAVDQDRAMLTAHVEVRESLCQHDRQELVLEIKSRLKMNYSILHTTIQIEHQDPSTNLDNCGCN